MAEQTDPKNLSMPRHQRLGDVTGSQGLVGLASHDEPGVAVATEDHGRSRDAVVVVRERVSVGTGGGRGDDVTRGWIRQEHIPGDDVAGLAVLSGEVAAL